MEGYKILWILSAILILVFIIWDFNKIMNQYKKAKETNPNLTFKQYFTSR
jgi:tellurite resistance protein TehA-like permease